MQRVRLLVLLCRVGAFELLGKVTLDRFHGAALEEALEGEATWRLFFLSRQTSGSLFQPPVLSRYDTLVLSQGARA